MEYSLGESLRIEYLYEKAEWEYRSLSISEKVEEFAEMFLEGEELYLPLAEQAELLDDYKSEIYDYIISEWL